MAPFIDKKTLKMIVDTWGIRAQVIVTLEELAELQKALCKLQRQKSDETVENLVEEIADVELMLEQIKFIYNVDELDIFRHKTAKMHRTISGIEL